MTKDELVEEVSKLKRVATVPGVPGTFMERVPMRPVFHFLRPATDDVVLMTSVMNAKDEAAAITHADHVLTFGAENLSRILSKPVVRIEPFDSGHPKFTAFVALAPSIMNFFIGEGKFLKKVTTGCFAINAIEFSGDETQDEAVIRRKHAIFSDLDREPTPVIFARYQKQTGQRSEHYLAILKRERAADFIREMPRDGGVVELENWQRSRMTLTTDKGNSLLEVTFDGKTKSLPVEDAVKLMDELVLRGVEAAQKAW